MDMPSNIEVTSQVMIEHATFTYSDFSISGIDFIDVRDYGAAGDGEMSDSSSFQKALDLAQGKEELHIYVPEGIYRMTDTLHFYSNTTITLDSKAEIIRDHNGYLLMNGTSDISFRGYNGPGNIMIEGGIWNQNGVKRPARASAFTFKHAKGLTIRDLIIQDSSDSHAIELNSTYDATIDNVYFLGINNVSNNVGNEALQLDLAKGSTVNNASYDNTPCKLITIQNCYFGDSVTPGTHSWPRAIGSHSSTIGRWNEDIVISNNKFENIEGWAIRAYSWNDVVINENEFINNEGGIAINSPFVSDPKDTVDVNGKQTNKSQTCSSYFINGNQIKGNRPLTGGIKIIGERSGRITDVEISNNIIELKESKYALLLKRVERGTIYDNKILTTDPNNIIIKDSSEIENK